MTAKNLREHKRENENILFINFCVVNNVRM